MYKSFNDAEDSPLSGDKKHKLKKRTKIIIFSLIVIGLAVLVTTVVVLSVKHEKDKGHKTCILNEVKDNPPAPLPERILLRHVSLPPTSPSTATGACTMEINPKGTGCIDPGSLSLQSGSFLPDGNHVLCFVTFSGAPAPPSPSAIYSGKHIIVIKVDGNTFPNGDTWKCITCGVPSENAFADYDFEDLSYPQSFHDGQRILAGHNNIISCSPYNISDPSCTPSSTFLYSIYWSGGSTRELRIHPNNSYIGFNAMFTSGAVVSQYGGMGSLSFNPSLSRYEINNATLFYVLETEKLMLYLNPSNSSEILFNPNAPFLGEFRGWSKDGTQVLWIGQPVESGNFDIMATSLATGETTRLTRNQEYADPVDMSPDNNWTIVMDTRGSNRLMFAAGIRGIPPLSDIATASIIASIRNNGDRRFFQGYLIDKYGDRGSYQGQKLTESEEWNDPNWNGMADPRWSPNGTLVAFYQSLASSPACGGINPLPCPSSSEPGGRRTRMAIATLADRKPTPSYSIPPIPSVIPWGTPYVPGKPLPLRTIPIPDGTYTLRGKVSGTALFSISTSHSSISVSVQYSHYSDDGYFIINGDESMSNNQSFTIVSLLWKSNIVLSGCEEGRKFTSEEGYKVVVDFMNPLLESSGTLTTILNGVTYTSPMPGT